MLFGEKLPFLSASGGNLFTLVITKMIPNDTLISVGNLWTLSLCSGHEVENYQLITCGIIFLITNVNNCVQIFLKLPKQNEFLFN